MAGERTTQETPNKMVLIGDEDVGKTTIFTRFSKGKFVDSCEKTTAGAEHRKVLTTGNGSKVEVTLFDTAGMERFTYTIPPTYFRHAKVVLLVYSVDNIESLTDLEDWVTNFDAARIGDNSEIIRVLVGNKSDLTTSESIERLADGVAQKCEVPDDMKFVISAKSGDGFDDMFSTIAERVGDTSLTSKPRSTSIRVTESDNKDKKPLLSCCRKS